MATRPDSDDFITYECRDRVGVITFNRPEKLNAFNDFMIVRLARVLYEFDIDPNADVAILRGAGRAFCAGADVHQRHLRKDEDFAKHGSTQGWGADSSQLLVRAVNWKPIIAAPHGFAVGLGLGMTFESDLVVAEEGTKFQVAEVSRGLAASRYWAILKFRGAGSFGTDVTITGRFFTAEEAFKVGIVDRLAPAGKGLEVATELAKEIASKPPLGIRATVRTRRWYLDQAEREAYLQTLPLKLHLTEDFQESARAFAEKRKPGPFKGR